MATTHYQQDRLTATLFFSERHPAIRRYRHPSMETVRVTSCAVSVCRRAPLTELTRASSEGFHEHLSESGATPEPNVNGVRRVSRNETSWHDTVCTEGYQEHLSLARHRLHRELPRAAQLSRALLSARALKCRRTQRGGFRKGPETSQNTAGTMLERP